MRTPTRTWIPTLESTEEPRDASALGDIHPLVARLVDAFGAAFVARILDVDRAMVTRWMRGTKISSEMAGRILDVHAVFSRAFQVFQPQHAMLWMLGNEPFFNGARPIDMLALRGSAPLIEALNGIEAGAYA